MERLQSSITGTKALIGELTQLVSSLNEQAATILTEIAALESLYNRALLFHLVCAALYFAGCAAVVFVTCRRWRRNGGITRPILFSRKLAAALLKSVV